MLITGAAKRIGAALAQRFHAAGFKIVLHYRQSKDQTQELWQQLNAIKKDSCEMIQADFNQTHQISQMVSSVEERFGRLDVLVNNASEFFETPLASFTEENYDRLFNSNVKGPLFLSRECQNLLNKSAGCIVNLVDIHADKPLKNHPIYSMAKAANKMMVMALAKEMAPKIRVNGVSPGCIIWPEKPMDSSIKQTILNRTALKSLGQAEQIFKAVKFLIENQFITGEVINVDGGRSLNM